MNDLEKLKIKLKCDIDNSNNLLGKISDLVKVTPSIERWKYGKEVNLKIISELPNYFAEEIAPSLIAWEEEIDNKIFSNSPTISDISIDFIKAVESSSGSTTPYIVNASNAIISHTNFGSEDAGWMDRVSTIINDHSLRIM